MPVANSFYSMRRFCAAQIRQPSAWLTAVCLFLPALVATAQEPERGSDERSPYIVEFAGLEETGLQEDFEDLSETLARRKEPVDSDTQLRRRMNEDVETFRKLLRARGYYEHLVDIEVGEIEGRRVARFVIEAGPQFTFDELSIVSTDPEFATKVAKPEDVGLVPGEPALADVVTGADTKILGRLRRAGHPFPSIVNREATVDFDTNTMQVTIEVDPGAEAVFGDLRITGLDKVKPVVPNMEQPWKTGDAYDIRQIDKFRNRLYETGLFTVVRVEPVPPVDDGRVTISLDVTERKHRSIGFGVSYYTDEGAGTEFFWEHRNLWQLGRKFRLEAKIAQQEVSFKSSLILERFRRQNQQLTASIGAGIEDTDAYDSQEVGGALILSRELHRHLDGSIGFAVRFTEVEQLDDTEHFQLFSLPMELVWDNTDDALNPTRGIRVTGQAEPFVDVLGDTSEFFKTQLTTSYYIAFDDDATWVFAHRIKFGSILSDSLADVPADERFYAGGGGSIRGYPFQSVGPLFADEEPIGGLSLFETAFEIRYRFTDQFGLVGFVDGGRAFESNFPDFSEPLRWGAGLGFRYYSPIGPFRFDVAVPIDKEDHIDDAFQVYLSLGQSF